MTLERSIESRIFMAKMKAVHVPEAGADFEIVERGIPQPGPGHSEDAMRFAARAGVRPMSEKFPPEKAAEAGGTRGERPRAIPGRIDRVNLRSGCPVPSYCSRN